MQLTGRLSTFIFCFCGKEILENAVGSNERDRSRRKKKTLSERSVSQGISPIFTFRTAMAETEIF